MAKIGIKCGTIDRHDPLRNMEKPMNFAEIVRSSTRVRESFRGLLVLQTWWRVILALHGKPIDIDKDSHHARVTLVRGFRFYGHLYLSLAIITLVAIPVILATGAVHQGFWVSLLLGSSCYLGLTSTLAFSGSSEFQNNNQRARTHLIVFFVAVIAYLACFCGVVMTIVHIAFPAYYILTVVAALLFMLVGIGSYLIEILFLVLETDLQGTK